MKLKLRHIGSKGGGKSTIIELTVMGYSAIIVDTVTDLQGQVDEDLIENLREIADELEVQNEKLKNDNT